jgi:hypothetical protein
MAEVIYFRNEPVVGCPCGCDLWRLIVRPEKDNIPRNVLFFECMDCESRISTNITMREVSDDEVA